MPIDATRRRAMLDVAILPPLCRRYVDHITRATLFDAYAIAMPVC